MENVLQSDPLRYAVCCALVFFAAYLLNMIYITVFYHRALTHRSVHLHPWIENFVVLTGNWITGLDPKGWACMHRMHHEHSDTARDPHSPLNGGVAGVLLQQLYSYNKTLSGLIHGKRKYTMHVTDLRFGVNWLNRHHLWYLPYVLHAVIGLSLGLFFHLWLLGLFYWLGMMSHPIQGWMVNALAHRYGYRNFNTRDNSRNNFAVALLVFGEGYQNNHHEKPQSANFSHHWWEVDLGYVLCRGMAWLGVLKIPPGQSHRTNPAAPPLIVSPGEL